MENRTLSTVGLTMLKGFEGCRLQAYKPIATEKNYTIGYGHCGCDVLKGMKISETKAEQLLITDVAKFEKKVNTYMKKYNFNQNQFDALVCFAYNIGDIKTLTNNGKRSIQEISEKIPLFCNAGGKKLAGLVSRRIKEKELFDTPVIEKCAVPISDSRFVVGSCVVYSSCYNSSTDPISKAISVSPTKSGVVTKIIDAPNGYGISDKVGGTIRCWCNVGDFR